jgi:hypothetical protein
MSSFYTNFSKKFLIYSLPITPYTISSRSIYLNSCGGYVQIVRGRTNQPILNGEVVALKCLCGRFITQQAKALAKIYGTDGGRCIHCLAENLNVPYQELLDRYMGIYECRSCAQDNRKKELRRKLLGLGG